MSVEGVMVSYTYTAEHGDPAPLVCVSTSGVRRGRWVLTAGALLAPLPPAPPRPLDGYYATLPPVICHSLSGEAVSAAPGRIRHVWRCPRLHTLTQTHLAPFTVAHRLDDRLHQGTAGKDLLSVFVLIDLDIHDTEAVALRPLSELYDLVGPPPARGDLLEIHSTPFGCEAFMNSVTSGRVCAALGGDLVLTDASTALGSEGGPVFAVKDGRKVVVGVVVSSVSWWRGEWVGATLVAPLQSLLASKLHLPPPPPPHNTPLRVTPRTTAIEQIDRCVVLVRCGAGWGAGLYLGAGLFLTCAHVVHDHAVSKVTIYGLGVSERAIVRYCSGRDAPYDLAVLYSNEGRWGHLTAARLATRQARVGGAVWAGGFPYFTERDLPDPRPVLSAGRVTNVSQHMLQTSCNIQSGFSGGGIFRVRCMEEQSECGVEQSGGWADGEPAVEVVGVVVCNARSEGGAVFPTVNMAVPTAVFAGTLTQFINDRDVSKLEALQNHKDPVHAQWRLMPYRSKV